MSIDKSYTIKKIPETNQDNAMKMHRYHVTFPHNNESFICTMMDSRPDHIYFSDNVQFTVDGDLLDIIEEDILQNFK